MPVLCPYSTFLTGVNFFVQFNVRLLFSEAKVHHVDHYGKFSSMCIS